MTFSFYEDSGFTKPYGSFSLDILDESVETAELRTHPIPHPNAAPTDLSGTTRRGPGSPLHPAAPKSRKINPHAPGLIPTAKWEMFSTSRSVERALTRTISISPTEEPPVPLSSTKAVLPSFLPAAQRQQNRRHRGDDGVSVQRSCPYGPGGDGHGSHPRHLDTRSGAIAHPFTHSDNSTTPMGWRRG